MSILMYLFKYTRLSVRIIFLNAQSILITNTKNCGYRANTKNNLLQRPDVFDGLSDGFQKDC